MKRIFLAAVLLFTAGCKAETDTPSIIDGPSVRYSLGDKERTTVQEWNTEGYHCIALSSHRGVALSCIKEALQ